MANSRETAALLEAVEEFVRVNSSKGDDKGWNFVGTPEALLEKFRGLQWLSTAQKRLLPAPDRLTKALLALAPQLRERDILVAEHFLNYRLTLMICPKDNTHYVDCYNAVQDTDEVARVPFRTNTEIRVTAEVCGCVDVEGVGVTLAEVRPGSDEPLKNRPQISLPIQVWRDLLPHILDAVSQHCPTLDATAGTDEAAEVKGDS